MNTKKRCISLGISILLFSIVIYDYIITGENIINFNDIIYLPFWFLFLSYLSLRIGKYNFWLKKNINFILGVTIFSNFLIIVFWLLDRNYFYNGRHRMASGLFLLIIELYYYIVQTKKRKPLLWTILPIFGILSSTSRTYVVMTALFSIIAYYKECRKKSTFYFSIIPLCAIGFILIMNSDIGKYFAVKQVAYFDFWGSVTSGRTIFWEKDIEAYLAAKRINQWLGSGFNFVYYVNKMAIDAYIYAHNDFINILMANGLIGLFIYAFSFLSFINETIKREKFGFNIMTIIIIIFIFNAVFNGQYNYPAAVFSILFLFEAFGQNRIHKKH